MGSEDAPDDKVVAVPPFNCGDGYRQLARLEAIQDGDEFYGGTDQQREWVKATCTIGCRYRPYTANSIYAPYAIHRRAVVATPETASMEKDE